MPRFRFDVSSRRQAGFALLITITLVAFLVLVLVSLATLTRVETRVAANSQQMDMARQNAVMALNVAIGRLQAEAGPDRRVTATGDLVFGAHDDKRRWTGVWNTTAASPAARWLVSTADGQPPTGTAGMVTALPTTGTVELVGAGTSDTATAGNAVRVETQAIMSDASPGTNGSNAIIGHMAYWVGDEGVKAKVSMTDPWAATSATTEQNGYRLRLALRAGVERVDAETGSPLGDAYPVNSDELGHVVGLAQLPLSNPVERTRLSLAVKNRFHDLTAESRSVLADVAKGGLKKDLTSWLAHPSLASGAPADTDFMAALDTGDGTGFGMPRWGLLRSYATLARGAIPLPPSVQTDTQHGLYPVVSYFRMAFGVSCPGDDEPLVAHLFPVLVLWNPHDTAIAADQYEFVFGLRNNSSNVTYKAGSTIKARLLFSSSPRLSATADTLSPDGSAAARTYTRLLLNAPIMQPGQSLVFTLDSTGPYVSPGLSGAIPMSPNNPPAVDNSLEFTNASIKLTATERAGTMTVGIPGGEFDMALYPPQPATPNPTVATWRTLTPYHLVQRFGLTARSNVLSIPQDPADAIPGPHYWFRLPVLTSLNNQFYRNSRWLANLDPVAPLHLLVDGSPVLRQSYLNDSTGGSPNPDVFDGNQVSAGYYASPLPSRALVVHELGDAGVQTEARLLSIAQLQHVNFSKQASSPSYAVGNSEIHYVVAGLSGPTATATAFAPSAGTFSPVSETNRIYDLSYLLNQTLWDRYFFSGVPQSLTDAQISSGSFHLANARHVFRHDDGGRPLAADMIAVEGFNRAAAGLMVDGGFNVNSTSEQAWRALLAAHNKLDSTSSGETHPYSRFAGTSVGDASNQALTSGYRILSDAQIDRLAANIVAEVRSRGPFLSLADFVNRRRASGATGYKGPLQSAIDATDLSPVAAERINDLAPFNDSNYYVGTQSYFPSSAATTSEKKIHLASDEDPDVARTRPSGSRAAFMPGFLTQADLLTSLGPVLAARSDTFRVRAYGDVQNPATGDTGSRAWCEAVVQRLPEYVEESVRPWETPAAGTNDETFGRRFKVVSFRWLTPDDI